MSFPVRWSGYTLTEVVIAVGVVAISSPLILALVVSGGETSRLAEEETRAVFAARTVYEEMRRAQEDKSEFLSSDDFPWTVGQSSASQFGGSNLGGAEDEDRWLIFEMNRDGEILRLSDDMGYEDRFVGEDLEVTSIAAVRGYGAQLEELTYGSGSGGLEVLRIEVRIESPARAPQERRKREVFVKNFSSR
ncbi:MAG: hypothetical protein AAGC74_05345 [Verrucomicrobiota bacterium]